MTRTGVSLVCAAALLLAGVAALLLWRATPESAPEAAGPTASPDWLATVFPDRTARPERQDESRNLHLPQDHAPHPGAISENWQVLAHLEDETGNMHGLQFSLFRIALADHAPAEPASDWVAHEIYRGHVALVDAATEQTPATERFGRGMPDVAGFDQPSAALRLDGWVLSFGSPAQDDPWRLKVDARGSRAELELTARKAPVSGPPDSAPFRGYAFSRLDVQGTLETDGGVQRVTGFAWFDHLWGDLPVPGTTAVVSDRLVLHLDDGSELSVIRSRRQDGRGTPTVDAVRIAADGQATRFDDAAQGVTLTRFWQGRLAAWPVAWSLELGDLDLSVTPVFDDQEREFMIPLWSGLVRATGYHDKIPVTGSGTLQLTGYAAQ